jgi:hypothetical protein
METGNIQVHGQVFQLPTVTTAIRDSISPVEKGYKVYNSDTSQENTYNGTPWEVIPSAGTAVQGVSGANQVTSIEVVTVMPAIGSRVANRLYFLIG